MSRPDFRRLGFLIALGALLAAVGQAQVAVGDTFPSLASAGLSGGAVPETEGRVVLVDFWASWCAPCKASFPAYARINAEYSPRGLVLVAVSVDEKPAAFAAFVKKWQPSFAVLHDSGLRLVRAVAVPAMPTSYVIGRDGRVRFIHQGFHGEATEAELRQHLDALLAEKG